MSDQTSQPAVGATAFQRLLVRLAYGIGIVAVAVLYAIYVVGWRIVDPTDITWLYDDPATYYLGWAFFRHDPSWGWPLTMAHNLGYPLGISVSYLDVIPWLALLFRPFSNLLPVIFQYLGMYYVLSCILQLYFGFKLIRLFAKTDLLIAVMGGLFILIDPAFTWRAMAHFALGSHWLLIASFYYFFADTETRPIGIKRILPLMVLCVVAGATTPYLAVMTLLVNIGTQLRWVDTERTTLRVATASALGLVAVTILSLFIFGFLIDFDQSQYTGGGYTRYAMNFLSPIDPENIPSLLFRQQPLGPGALAEETGYNYLGLGVILLLAISIVRQPAILLSLFRRRARAAWAIFLISLVLAMSTKAAFGGFQLYQIPVPQTILHLLEMFRVSGRLFWPGHYLLVIGALAAAFTVFKGNSRRVLVAIMLLLQIADTSGLRTFVRNTQIASTPLHSPEWANLHTLYPHLVVAPAFQCSAPDTPGGRRGYWIFGRLAVETGMTLNSYYAARSSARQTDYFCNQQVKDIADGKLDDDTAYVLSPSLIRSLLSKDLTSHYCREVDGFALCSKTDHAPGISPELVDLSIPLQLHDVLNFDTVTPHSEVLAQGWSTAEPLGRWSDGSEARIVLRLQGHPIHPARVAITFAGFLAAALPAQHIVVSTGGKTLANWVVDNANPAETGVIEIPPGAVSSHGIVDLTFQFADAASPLSIDINPDTRRLAMRLIRLEIQDDGQ